MLPRAVSSDPKQRKSNQLERRVIRQSSLSRKSFDPVFWTTCSSETIGSWKNDMFSLYAGVATVSTLSGSIFTEMITSTGCKLKIDVFLSVD
jgi:hypothetical protein